MVLQAMMNREQGGNQCPACCCLPSKTSIKIEISIAPIIDCTANACCHLSVTKVSSNQRPP